MPSVEERVKQIVVDQLGVDPAEVTAAASFAADLGADSLDAVELIMAFEEAFDVSIPDEQAQSILTVGQAIEYLEKNAKSIKHKTGPGPQFNHKKDKQPYACTAIQGKTKHHST